MHDPQFLDQALDAGGRFRDVLAGDIKQDDGQLLTTVAC